MSSMTTNVQQRRTLENCPHRLGNAGSAEAMAHCHWLEDIVGASNQNLYQVSRQACETCCQSFAPSPEAPNPVVASLLFAIAEKLLDEPNVSAETRARAEQILQTAEDSLPVTYSDEDEVL